MSNKRARPRLQPTGGLHGAPGVGHGLEPGHGSVEAARRRVTRAQGRGVPGPRFVQ